MKSLLLITVGFVSIAFVASAQPSLTLSVGTASSLDGEDPYSLTNSPWPMSGQQTDDGITIFSAMSGLHFKAGLGWEISDHFSTGLALQMLNLSSDENFRTADVVSIGVQFRVNFSSSQNQWVPFFQGAYYLSNSQYYDQKQATKGTQTQPAFTASGSSNLGFNVDFGLEYKLSKSMGLQFTTGLNGLQPIDAVPDADYSPYVSPKNYNGGFFLIVAGGIKYYFGRGDKKRDF